MEREREKGEALPLTWFCESEREREKGDKAKKESAGLCRTIFRKKTY